MTIRFSGRIARRIGAGLALTLAVTVAAVAQDLNAPKDGVPTPEQYVATAGGDSRILQKGEFVLDGHRPQCGHRPTVVDSKLDDYGAAYPGFIIMNPKYLAKVSTPVKMWIYAHECGHQFRGPDEQTADCFAVQRGRRYGWLTQEGLEEVCSFIAPAKGDAMHFSGSYRCDYMRKCFADPSIR
ncbi:hypothetical protein DLM45_08280 [Hyphomicrobium methylovorum]|uniref:hypothetical protein n=1 Tax=Hyphomicrobium methylovorum TaxID=84 RepID=UPI0015E64805|nr:hypothetical protein [Hyphomicrobium methylovorum]MBA2126218.1 hypothetical protein [Hyphomicrobium methylovorum]